jgi:AcrR family transcriptional regulator
MTEKQANILRAALTLFSETGYTATSTSKVARQAGVSEGLIFRHFGNKEGLLQTILKEGEENFKQLYADIVMESDPKAILRKSIALPFDVPSEDHNFWRLLYKLKWELQQFDALNMEPLERALTYAFEQLKYAQPALEAQLLILIIDAIGSAILKEQLQNAETMKRFLLDKYDL